MAWRSQMGRVLVGRSLVGRLWRRSLLGIYTRWLGLELPLRAATGYVPQCAATKRKSEWSLSEPAVSMESALSLN